MSEARHDEVVSARRLALSELAKNWSRTTLQQRVVKTGRGTMKHARHYQLLLRLGSLLEVDYDNSKH